MKIVTDKERAPLLSEGMREMRAADIARCEVLYRWDAIKDGRHVSVASTPVADIDAASSLSAMRAKAYETLSGLR